MASPHIYQQLTNQALTQGYLLSMTHPRLALDEVNVLLHTDKDLAGFVGYATVAGWEQFDDEDDHVAWHFLPTDDAGSYGVRYVFLRKQGVPFRIEAMLITKGTSPVHTLLGPVPHVSFKVADERRLQDVIYSGYEGWWPVQHCRSSYGAWTYLLRAGQPSVGATALKPRVNLRDGTGTQGTLAV